MKLRVGSYVRFDRDRNLGRRWTAEKGSVGTVLSIKRRGMQDEHRVLVRLSNDSDCSDFYWYDATGLTPINRATYLFEALRQAIR